MSASASTASAYMRKAERALAGARVLLLHDDVEGACSRAYYAMVDAARAALMVVLPATASEGEIKTHRGLITAFGRHLVVTGSIDPALGRSLNQVEKLRLSADYLGDMPAAEDGGWAIEQADAFIGGIRRRFPDL